MRKNTWNQAGHQPCWVCKSVTTENGLCLQVFTNLRHIGLELMLLDCQAGLSFCHQSMRKVQREFATVARVIRTVYQLKITIYVYICTIDQVERSPWDQFHTVPLEICLWPSFVSSHVKAMLFRTHPTSAKASMSAPDLPSWGLFLWRPPLPPGHGLRQSMLPRRPQRGVARPGYSHRWDAWQGSRMGGDLGAHGPLGSTVDNVNEPS